MTTSFRGWDPTADFVMVEYCQKLNCGWYSRTPHDGGDVTRAVLKMTYENGYCSCP